MLWYPHHFTQPTPSINPLADAPARTATSFANSSVHPMILQLCLGHTHTHTHNSLGSSRGPHLLPQLSCRPRQAPLHFVHFSSSPPCRHEQTELKGTETSGHRHCKRNAQKLQIQGLWVSRNEDQEADPSGKIMKGLAWK